MKYRFTVKFEITYVSSVKVKRPPSPTFQFYRKVLFADCTGVIYGLVKFANESELCDEMWSNMVSVMFVDTNMFDSYNQACNQFWIQILFALLVHFNCF